MSKGIRVDAVDENPATGEISINVTFGTTPLPAEPGGMVLTFPSRTELAARVAEFEENLDPYALLAITISRYVDQTGNANLDRLETQLPGKTSTMTVDLAPSATLS